ncbi:MAG TPA: acetate/propionate family kinase [Candidatus Dormibacteraeota bacterium]|nr:acetate/propionate family kinase [Candidatus Dormibacteraeota bacterium]
MRVLVVNAGSSSLKIGLVDDDAEIAELEFKATAGRFDDAELESAVRGMEGVEAVGHRVVHGGPRYASAVRVTPEVVDYLVSITDMAPLHLPASLAGIAAVKAILPRVPAVACFDTSFHSKMPAEASTYAIPLEWRTEYGIRRYGFHGFSHRYASRRAAEILGRPEAFLRTVTCHLGSGASCAAVLGGKSVDTTMGFTPMEGLVMATRSGSVDPGMVLWLERHAGMTEPQLNEGLDQKSGLVGLAGVADMREVLRGMAAGVERSRLAFDVYVHRLRAHIGSMAAAMNGVDAIVFTGGVGENAPAVREAAASGLAFLGVEVDPDLNRKIDGDGDVSAADAEVRTLVVHAREDVEVAREVRGVLSESG